MSPNDRSIETMPVSPERAKERAKVMEDLRRSAGVVHFMDQYATLIDEFGGDVLIGLIPGVGDAGSTIASLFTQMVQASRVGLPFGDRFVMLFDQLADLGIGAVPVVGDIADYFYKSNVAAKDRFVRHFERQLLDAWKKGFVTPAETADLAKVSGVSITLPTEQQTATDNRASRPRAA